MEAMEGVVHEVEDGTASSAAHTVYVSNIFEKLKLDGARGRGEVETFYRFSVFQTPSLSNQSTP